MVDEHLSPRSAFLTLGAREVVGGVYRVEPGKIGTCYNTILREMEKKGPESANLPGILKNWREKKLGAKKPVENASVFYETIPVRIMGFPGK